MIDKPHSLVELRQQLPRMKDLEERAFEPEANAPLTTEAPAPQADTIDLDELLLMYGSLLSTPEAEVHFENGETIIELRDTVEQPTSPEEKPHELVLAMISGSDSGKVNNPFPKPTRNDRSPALPKNITDGLAEKNKGYPIAHRIAPRRPYHEQPTLGELRSHVEENIDDTQGNTDKITIETTPDEAHFEEIIQTATTQTNATHEKPRTHRAAPGKLKQVLLKSKYVFEVGYGFIEFGSTIPRKIIARNRAKYLMTREEYAAEVEANRQASFRRSFQEAEPSNRVEDIIIFEGTQPADDEHQVESAAVESLEFSTPKNTGRIRNWMRKRVIATTSATQSLFEKAKRHPAVAVAAIGGVALTSAFIGYKFGISRGSGTSNQVADVITNHPSIPTTSTIDKATGWYQLYQQHNPNVSRDQFNQIINSVEFKNMCENPVEFAKFMSAV